MVASEWYFVIFSQSGSPQRIIRLPVLGFQISEIIGKTSNIYWAQDFSGLAKSTSELRKGCGLCHCTYLYRFVQFKSLCVGVWISAGQDGGVRVIFCYFFAIMQLPKDYPAPTRHGGRARRMYGIVIIHSVLFHPEWGRSACQDVCRVLQTRF